MSLETLLQALVAACAVYLVIVYGSYLALMGVGFRENRKRIRELAADDPAELGGSRFSPGISVVVAAYNEASALPAAVRSLLTLDYPQFEVVVVNDGSTDDTLERLVAELDLVPVEASSRSVVETEEVRGYYRAP